LPPNALTKLGKYIRNRCESGHTQRAAGSAQFARTKTSMIDASSDAVAAVLIIGVIIILPSSF
jgi:hypothetical protein